MDKLTPFAGQDPGRSARRRSRAAGASDVGQGSLQLLRPDTGTATVKAVLDSLFPGLERQSANKRLQRFVARVNERGEGAGVSVRLAMSTARSVGAERRHVWFEGKAGPEVGHATRALEGIPGTPVEQKGRPLFEARIILSKRTDGKPLVKAFISGAEEDKVAVDAFLTCFEPMLRSSGRYSFEFLRPEKILVGENLSQQTEAMLSDSHLGLFLLSPSYLANPTLKALAGSFEWSPEGASADRRMVPVLLKTLPSYADFAGFDERRIFRDENYSAFVENVTEVARAAWAEKLSREIHELLDKYAEFPEDATPELDPDTVAAGADVDGPLGRQWCRDLEETSSFVSGQKGKTITLSPDLTSAAGEGPEKDALAYLTDWLSDADAPDLFALLGRIRNGQDDYVSAAGTHHRGAPSERGIEPSAAVVL